MRIALATEGTRGDVYPMLALAEALRARGHEAWVCAPPDFAAACADRGLEFRPVGTSVQALLDDHAEAVAHGGVKLLRAVSAYAAEAIGLQFSQLPDATSGADLVVGAGVQVAARSVAELHRAAYRYVVYCPILIPSEGHTPLLFPSGSPSRPLPPWLNRWLWRIGKFAFNAGMRRPVNRERRQLGLGPIRDVYSHLLTDRPVVASDAELIGLPDSIASQVDLIPCLHPLEEDALPDKLESFLAEGPPPVYFGFGSMTDPDATATTRTLLDAISRVGCRALISEGWAGLGDGALSSGVMQIGAVSHAALFRRVAAVVHHGGAGTTTTSARAGAPQILVPHLMDQYYWAQRIRSLGIGPPAIPRKRLTSAQLAETISATLESEWTTLRARELGERLRDAAGADPTEPFVGARSRIPGQDT